MTNVKSQLLSCLRAYRRGAERAEPMESLSPAQWRELYALAAVHKLTPVVYDTLYAAPGFCDGAEGLADLWKKDAILQSVGQTARTQKLLELTAALEAEGICYAVVKGVLCRRLYRKPDLRPSGDEDLFVSAGEYLRCEAVLHRLGFLPLSQQEAGVKHWKEPTAGLHLEVHETLFSTGWAAEETLNAYFAGQLNHTVLVGVEQGTVRTLEPTAHLVFLVAHALKHLITGGFGVRILADILMFCENYEAEICQEELRQRLEEICGWDFFAALLRIGQNDLNFDPAPWGCLSSENSDDKDLLNDMLDAGVYGQTSMERKHSAALVLEASRGKGNSLLSTVFPPRSRMEGRYPILRRVPALLPAAWLCRICSYGAEVLRGRGTGNSPGAALALGNQRMEMMVRYGIFPQGKTEDR